MAKKNKNSDLKLVVGIISIIFSALFLFFELIASSISSSLSSGEPEGADILGVLLLMLPAIAGIISISTRNSENEKVGSILASIIYFLFGIIVIFEGVFIMIPFVFGILILISTFSSGKS